MTTPTDEAPDALGAAGMCNHQPLCKRGCVADMEGAPE